MFLLDVLEIDPSSYITRENLTCYQNILDSQNGLDSLDTLGGLDSLDTQGARKRSVFGKLFLTLDLKIEKLANPTIFMLEP